MDQQKYELLAGSIKDFEPLTLKDICNQVPELIVAYKKIHLATPWYRAEQT